MTTVPPLGSVVIPAHNESSVIRRCIDSLLENFQQGELNVVVACNGCTDDTAELARSSAYPVKVLELRRASKPAALRAGEEAASGFPRLYLDADVVLTSGAARLVLERLQIGPALAARPPIQYDTAGSASLVRRYYRARAAVPAVMGSLWGAGVYGLSQAGRARFDRYPDVVADDLFVDRHFQSSEIEIVAAAPVIVRAPRKTADLVRILRRTYNGNAENRRVMPLATASPPPTPSTVRDLARLAAAGPVNAIDVATYVTLAALARGSLAMVRAAAWERDNSSRSG